MSHSSNYKPNQARGDNGHGSGRGGSNVPGGQHGSFTSAGSHDPHSNTPSATTSPENRHSRIDLLLNPTTTPSRTPDRQSQTIPPISQLTGHSPTQPIPPITQIAALVPRRRSAAHFDDGFDGFDAPPKRLHPISPIDGPSQPFISGRPRGSTLPRLTSPNMPSGRPLLASHVPFPGATSDLRRLSTAVSESSAHPSHMQPMTPQSFGRPPISPVNTRPVSSVSPGGPYPSPVRPPSAGPSPNMYPGPSHFEQGPGHHQSPFFQMQGHGSHHGYDFGEGGPPMGIHIVMDQTGSGSRESNNKRARNAEASARFRKKRSIREKEREETLKQMEQEISNLTNERNHLRRQSDHYRNQRDRYREERNRMRSVLEERNIETNFPPSPEPTSTPQPEPHPTAEELGSHQSSQHSGMHHHHMSPESEFRSGASTPMSSVHRGRHGSVSVQQLESAARRLSTSPHRHGSQPPGRMTPQMYSHQYSSAFPPPPPPPSGEFPRRMSLSESGRQPYAQEQGQQMHGREDVPREYSAQGYRPGPQPGSQSSSLQNSLARRNPQQNLHDHPR